VSVERNIYRVGIVGAGNISRLHLYAIGRHPNRMQAVALCDPDKETLTARAADYGISECYADLADMIAQADIDVAVVCTPTHVRREVLFPLIEAGIPTLCEKPFAETYAEAVAIEREARDARVPIAINQNFRRHFTFHLAREILARGHLGRPLHLVQSTLYLRRDTGWRLQRKRYVMAVMTIHWFDGYLYLLRDAPKTVYCRGVNSPATEGGDDTAVSVILQFHQGTVLSLSESFSSFARQGACSLDCERGALVMGYEALTEVRPDGERIEHRNPFDKAEATWYLLDDLMKAVEEQRAPETSAADNLNSMRILEGAYRSLEENRVVSLEEIE
jgi:predicted dehydrogenase